MRSAISIQLLGISDPPIGLAFILCGLLERRKHMKTRIAISLLAVVAARGSPQLGTLRFSNIFTFEDRGV
jgi:hypothetical protein